jgi:hypothetical protein
VQKAGPGGAAFSQPSLYLTPGNGQNPSGGGKYAFLKIRLGFSETLRSKSNAL